MLENDGDPRPIGEPRSAVLADLIRRPWDAALPSVTAHVTVTAPLPSLAGRSNEPAAVDGLPITAAHVREQDRGDECMIGVSPAGSCGSSST
ncbi:MAG: endonuclease [Frankiales bacterium]|nr:endonuclease [Frankiales bacterium]